MGQKTNSNLLRLGVNNNEWKSKYYSKTSEESSLLILYDLQIKAYIKQFLIDHGLIFHDYKLYLNDNTINLYISYYNGIKSVFLINKNIANNNLKLKKKTFITQKRNKWNSIPLKIKHQKRNHLLKKYKYNNVKKKYKTENNTQKNSFIEQFLESLSFFTNNKYNIYLTFQNLNSNLTINLTEKEQNLWKVKLLTLKKYSKNKFFKEAINVLLISTKSRNSAQLFADFIAKQFMVLKRQSYFLIFLKHILTLFINTPLSKIIGTKIIIKGRFNGAPRARNNIVSVGSVPVQTFDTKISYYQSVAFSSNGTFGIKVWVSEKS